MTQISKEIGLKIRAFRKKKGLTINELAIILCKSKATVSKYERGEITIDIDTLYEIAMALSVDIEQLLVSQRKEIISEQKIYNPAFFTGVNQFYSYLYDGRFDAYLISFLLIRRTRSTCT